MGQLSSGCLIQVGCLIEVTTNTGLTVFEEIPNFNIKRVKVTGVHNIGQGHQVKVPAESVHREEVLYKVWWLKALQLRTYGRVT